MTFPQLQYLLEIHRAGSITQAAKNLFVTQSSVSIALNAVEKELGFPVFIRSKKGLIPTPQGVDAIAHAKRIVESYQLMTTPRPQQRTNVRISSVTFLPAQNAFIRLLRENRDRKDVEFTMESGSRVSSIDKLLFFNLELALIQVLTPHYLAQEAKFREHGLEVEFLGSLPAAIQIGEGHPLFHAESITPSDFAEDSFLEVPGKTISRGLLKGGIMHIREDKIIISDQAATRTRLLQEGLVFAVSHTLPIFREPVNGIRYIPLEGLSYKLCAVTNPLHPPVPEVERFMELLKDELAVAGL